MFGVEQFILDACNRNAYIMDIKVQFSKIVCRMISQGASEINLTFVIEEDEVPAVIRRLHKAFFSELDPEVFA